MTEAYKLLKSMHAFPDDSCSVTAYIKKRLSYSDLAIAATTYA